MSDNQKSTGDLEHDVDQRRSEVGGTINALKDRFTPEAAADYGLKYIRGPGGQRLLGAIRDNPLAAMLVVGGLGWLFYTANQPEEERRRRPVRTGRRVRVYETADEAYLDESDLMPDNGIDPTSTVPDHSTSSVTKPVATPLGDPLYGSSGAGTARTNIAGSTSPIGTTTGSGTTASPLKTPSSARDSSRPL